MGKNMIKIRFNAFSFLKPKLKEKGILTPDLNMQIAKNISINKLIENLGLKENEVAIVFVNHKILSKETILKDGDRVALVPPDGVPNHVKAYVGATG
jgi:sulfur carrier protein ThiS